LKKRKNRKKLKIVGQKEFGTETVGEREREKERVRERERKRAIFQLG
jgi:hypothetical protein